jgi:type IV pilus assembly protein PilE
VREEEGLDSCRHLNDARHGPMKNFANKPGVIAKQGVFSAYLLGGRALSCLGFSLLEVLLAVAMMLICAAIAWPSYQSYIGREQRHLATLHLAAVMVGLEQAAASQGTYQHLNLSQLSTQQALPPSLKHSYQFSLQVEDAGRHYLLLATPTGKQARWDSDCVALTLDDRGRRGVTGSGDPEQCWR